MPFIEVQNLTKVYESEGVATPVLGGINLTIAKGEFVAIMGPSGSGKSTLLHILGFLDQQTSGTYHFEGKSINDYTSEQIAHVRNEKIGFVFQAFNLLARTSVLENVKLPFLYSRIPKSQWNDRARQAIQAVGLEHRLEYEPAKLSGGEKQRVAIARALVNNPEVIFADEPTGNLDSKSGKAVMAILQTLHRDQGHTVVLITHETYTAEHAERIIRLKDGVVESVERVTQQLSADAFTK